MNALDLIDPKCKQCRNSPSLVKSFHYYLELPSTEEKLREWIGERIRKGSRIKERIGPGKDWDQETTRIAQIATCRD